MKEDLLNAIKIKIYLLLGDKILSNLDVYNKYIIKDRDKFISDDRFVDILASELILSHEMMKSSKVKRAVNPWHCYRLLYSSTERCIKFTPNYEYYRLILSVLSPLHWDNSANNGLPYIDKPAWISLFIDIGKYKCLVIKK